MNAEINAIADQLERLVQKVREIEDELQGSKPSPENEYEAGIRYSRALAELHQACHKAVDVVVPAMRELVLLRRLNYVDSQYLSRGLDPRKQQTSIEGRAHVLVAHLGTNAAIERLMSGKGEGK